MRKLFVKEKIKALICDTYEVIQAFTGAEALEIISAQYETLSLILLDLNLPDIHGLDILRKIKEDPTKDLAKGLRITVLLQMMTDPLSVPYGRESWMITDI